MPRSVIMTPQEASIKMRAVFFADNAGREVLDYLTTCARGYPYQQAKTPEEVAVRNWWASVLATIPAVTELEEGELIGPDDDKDDLDIDDLDIDDDLD